MTDIERQGLAAKKAATVLMTAGTQAKNAALFAIAQALEENEAQILAANDKDMALAKENGMKPALKDRLRLDAQRIRAMADGVREVAALRDPIGRVENMETRPSGLSSGARRYLG